MGCSWRRHRKVNEEMGKETPGTQLAHDDEADHSDKIVHHVEFAQPPSMECESSMKIICKKRRWTLAILRFLTERKRCIINFPKDSENNAWLLANPDHRVGCKAGATENVDLNSVNSSFRFSFGSRDLDLEIISNPNSNPANAAATVLLVNLEKGSTESHDGVSSTQQLDFERMRILSLERHILPVVKSLIRFNYDEIRCATSNFSDGKVLGRGAHSCVYKGRLSLGRFIAVKKLEKNGKESDKAFCWELHIAGTLKNQHVVPLLGFCIDPLGLFLVYKFVSGGSLEYHLHVKRGKGRSMSWSARLGVAIGVAKAVDYLHHGTQKCVVHRDIKPSNILLSSRKTAKLCDFGLATWTRGASVPVLCKTVKGTFGYLAPEYFQHGKVSEKTDIYAFGVVLLELITGRKAIETKRPPGDENLVIWARPLLYRGLAEELIDPQLKSCYNGKQMDRMMHAAAVCLHPVEWWRPCMSHVVKILNGQQDTVLPRHPPLTLLDAGVGAGSWEHTTLLKAHLALAMVGVDLDDDNPRPYH